MLLDRLKFQICLARKNMSAADLRKHGVGCSVVAKVMRDEKITTKSAGKIACALGVDITEILKEE